MLKLVKVLLEKFCRKSQDPMKILPRKVIENILSHLNGTELLKYSCVSKEWYNSIASSPKFTEKVRICICEPYNGTLWKFTESDVNAFINGRRNYKHISMLITRNLSRHHLLLIASFKWKSLKLCHHTFKSEIELINFLGLIEPTSVELDFRSIKIVLSKQWQITSPKFKFPKLKSLRLINCCAYFHSIIFKNAEYLEDFEIETEPATTLDQCNQSSVRVRAILTMLVKNPRIKFLQLFICQEDFDIMFADLRFLSQFRCRLECLKVKKFRKLIDDRSNDDQINNFGEFLQTQKCSLSSFYILEWLGNDILEITINMLDKLKYLEIVELESYGKLGESIANMNLFKNESIETLVIKSKYSKTDELQKMLLKSVPNLKVLNIGTVNQIILDILIDKTLKIELINLDNFSAYLVPEGDVLNSLKEIQINTSYAQNFKDYMRDLHPYTNFETVFLKAAKIFNENENTDDRSLDR